MVVRFRQAVALAVLNLQGEPIVKKLNPFNGPGSLNAERQKRRREQFKVAVWAVVGANVVLITGLLIQGCRREPAATETAGVAETEAASPETKAMATAQPTPDTNAPVPPTFETPSTNTVAQTNTVTQPAPDAVASPLQTGAREYAVVKGDSFYKIAKANNVSMRALATANPGVDSSKLKIGQVLHIPTGAAPSAGTSPTPPAPAKATASGSSNRYVVKTGDTLSRIARAHGTTVQAIKTANSLTSDRIVPGHTLKLPQAKAVSAPSVQS